MAIVWPCPVLVEEYVALGRDFQVPRPNCPGCCAPMTFSSGYRRWVRVKGVCHRLWIRRGRCRPCRVSHALIPSFCLLGRLDVVASVGEAIVSVVMGATGVRPVAERLQVPFTTARDWVRKFTRSARRLWAGFSALSVRFSGLAPDLGGDTPAKGALAAIVHAWELAAERLDASLVLELFGFASVVTSGAMISSTTNPPWLVLGKKRFIPPVPQIEGREEITHVRGVK
jgi:hypothetical protein